MARLACNAVEVCGATKSGDMYALARLPPALLRMNGMFDCSAASGWTVKATIGAEASELAVTGIPPATNSRCAGAFTGVRLAWKKVPSADKKLVPLTGPSGLAVPV